MVDRIIAVNGNLELHAVDDTTGYVVDVIAGTKYDMHSIASILSKGEWMPPASTAVYREAKIISIKGGPGSGNFGHEGRPGHEGGSAADSSGSKTMGAADKPKKVKVVAKLSTKGQQHLEDEKRREARKKRDEARKLQNDMSEAARSRDAVGFTKAEAKLESLDWQGRPLKADRVLMGGNLTKAEAAVLDFAGNKPRFTRKEVGDSTTLDFLLNKGIVKHLPKLKKSYEQYYELTLAGHELRKQLYLVRKRITASQ